MDSYTKALLQNAYSVDDAMRAHWDSKNHDDLFDSSSDAVDNGYRCRAGARALVFKTTTTPQSTQRRQQSAPHLAADADQVKKPDWLILIEALCDESAEACARLEKKIQELNEKVLRLEVSNEILRGFVTSGNKATLTSIKGKDSNAA
jgi:hypothetical protein